MFESSSEDNRFFKALDDFVERMMNSFMSEFSDFEQKVENYFLKNNFTIGEIAATEDYEDYLDVAKEVAAGEFQGDVNYFMKRVQIFHLI